MKLIVGLGNPGEKFENTRHNTGFLVLDEIKNQISNFQFPIPNEENDFQKVKKFNSLVFIYSQPTTHNPLLILAKPQTFMNDSGKAVAKLSNFYKVNSADIWVIHDDLDIKLGQYKIQEGIGPKVHNGINSIEENLGKIDFWRVRVGIENRISNSEKIKGEEYVLQKFSDEETNILDGIIEDIVSDLSKRLNI